MGRKLYQCVNKTNWYHIRCPQSLHSYFSHYVISPLPLQAPRMMILSKEGEGEVGCRFYEQSQPYNNFLAMPMECDENIRPKIILENRGIHSIFKNSFRRASLSPTTTSTYNFYKFRWIAFHKIVTNLPPIFLLTGVDFVPVTWRVCLSSQQTRLSFDQQAS